MIDRKEDNTDVLYNEAQVHNGLLVDRQPLRTIFVSVLSCCVACFVCYELNGFCSLSIIRQRVKNVM